MRNSENEGSREDALMHEKTSAPVYTYLAFTVEQINSFDLKACFKEEKGDIKTENKEKSVNCRNVAVQI